MCFRCRRPKKKLYIGGSPSLNSRTSSKIPYRSHNFPLDVETGQSTLHVRVFSCVQEIEIQYGHGSLEREGNFGVSPYPVN